MVELLPCPFCGEKDHVFFHKVSSPEETGWAVVCGGRTNCAASVGRHVNMTKAEACAAWNRRVPSPNPVAAGIEGETDPKLVHYIAMLRHQCAFKGPCSDKGDGCTCSAEELSDRHLRSASAHPTPTPGGVTVPEGMRDGVIEECAKVADAVAAEDDAHWRAAGRDEEAKSHYLWAKQTGESIAKAIRALASSSVEEGRK